MKTTLFNLSVFALLCFGGTNIYAQEATVASGGEATGTGGTVSYSIGQVSYITNTGSNGTIGEGVQQPFEIQTLDVKENFKQFELILYPNPTRENLNLNTGELDLSNVDYKIYDSRGRIIMENSITESESTISLGDIPPGNYFLNIYKGTQSIKSFKVVKN